MGKNATFALLILPVAAAAAFGQAKSTAEVGGTVKDQSEALIPAAKVTVTAAETGLTREAVTDDEGLYRVVLLPPGIYDIKVEKPGFVAQAKKGIELTVGTTATIDFQLSVGAGTQIIEISAEAPLVESERSQQANTIEQNEVRNLPINRRDYLSFALLAPGISDSKAMADANSYRVKQTPDSGLSFYGGNGRGNSITVDGGEANDAGGGVRTTVSQEVVQEFQINRANYSAEHGGARGGVVNIVTKSGTNDVHGSVFAFFRHESLDAGDPFAIVLGDDNRIRRTKPPSQRQQFGGTLGGPIAKDRSFFFGGYEQLRRRESATVPVLTDLSIFQPTPQQQAILNALPAQAAAPLRAALTAPQSTIDLFRANSGVFPFQTDDYKVFFRVDHRANNQNQLAFRYHFTLSHETNRNVRALVGLSRGFVNDDHEQNGLVAWTRTFSSSVINEFRFQYDYHRPIVTSNDPYGPELNIAGAGHFNRDIFLPSDSITRREEMINNVSFTRGSHNWKAGTQVLVRSIRNSSATFFSGRFGFGPLPAAFIPGVAQISPALAATTLTSLQAFNLGLPQTYQQGFGDPVVRATYPLAAGFVQDSWRVAPSLTMNYGLRYEVDDRKDPLPRDTNNFAPRVCFAWNPKGDRRTVIRGGYGVFFSPTEFQIDYVVNALNEIGGYRQIAQVLSVLSAADPLARTGPINIFQTLRRQGVIGLPQPTRSITAADLSQFGIVVSQTGPRPPLTVLFRNSPDYVNSYSQQASLAVEREILPGLSLAVNYIWARGLKITRSRDDNLLDTAPISPTLGIRVWRVPQDFRNPLLLQDNVYESTGKCFYNGGIIELTRRFSRNVTLHFNYTFSKAIDDTVDFNSDFQANDQTNVRAERSLSSFDQRHKVVLFGVFQTPAPGPGASAARQLTGNWGFTPIFRANSARPFNLLVGAELNQDRHSTTDRPPFAGRNTGIGPNFWTFDMRLSRRFGFGDKARLELMSEFFNLFNRLNHASVNNVVGAIAGPFNLKGRPDRTPSEPLGFTSAFEARRIQFGLRLSF